MRATTQSIIRICHTNRQGNTYNLLFSIWLSILFTVGRNLVLNKTATQTTPYKNRPANYGLDGNLNTVMHSMNTDNPKWWSVDLGQLSLVKTVAIYAPPAQTNGELWSLYFKGYTSPFAWLRVR